MCAGGCGHNSARDPCHQPNAQPTPFPGLAIACTRSTEGYPSSWHGGALRPYVSEAGRPLDGSDIQTADEALEEVRRIRNILASASALPNHGSFTRMKMGTFIITIPRQTKCNGIIPCQRNRLRATKKRWRPRPAQHMQW